MRECPLCGVGLDRVEYEGFPVHTCPKCHGVLIDNRRIEDVKRKMEKPPAELVAEATADGAADTAGELACPRCNCAMAKEKAFKDEMATSRAGLESFSVDVCRQCDITWLDAGELAKIQIDYEQSPKGREARKRYVSYAELDDAEKEEFIRTMADAVPDQASSYAAAFADAVAQAAQVLWRVDD